MNDLWVIMVLKSALFSNTGLKLASQNICRLTIHHNKSSSLSAKKNPKIKEKNANI